MSYKVVHYINQFFANIGGEEMAHVAPELREGFVGPGMALNTAWKGEAEIVKTINYVCNIITNENVYLADKQRSSDWSAKLCRLLDLDGAIVSQEGFGNPDTDLIMNTKKIELQGVKTTIITDEYAGQDGKSQSLADADPLADAVVTGGNANEVIILPKMDKVIGMLDYVDVIAGGHAGSLREDGSIEAELQIITGATNEMGFNCMSAR